MRKISLVLVAVMLFSAGNIFAKDSKKEDPTKSLAVQIGELLEKNSFVVKKSDLIAHIRFTLNNDKEIVVLSVDSENEILKDFVKARLNYKKVTVNEYREGKTYMVPVRITE